MRYCPKCQAETDRYTRGACKPCSKAGSAAYHAANRETIRATHVAWRAANKEADRSKNSAYRAANREAICAWRAANKDVIRSATAAWRVANPEAVRAMYANRRALKKASVGQHTKADIKALFVLQKGKCVCCHTSIENSYHIDHIYALTNGGGNSKNDIQLLCPTCNLSKGAKDPIAFMQSKGFLL